MKKRNKKQEYKSQILMYQKNVGLKIQETKKLRQALHDTTEVLNAQLEAAYMYIGVLLAKLGGEYTFDKAELTESYQTKFVTWSETQEKDKVILVLRDRPQKAVQEVEDNGEVDSSTVQGIPGEPAVNG